jgi:hypothetical protein
MRVADLIEKLQDMPQDATVAYEDTDYKYHSVFDVKYSIAADWPNESFTNVVLIQLAGS